jgi:hypothetical protein
MKRDFGSYVASKSKFRDAGSSGDRVKVFCRLRPALAEESAAVGGAFLTAPPAGGGEEPASCIQQHGKNGTFSFHKDNGEAKHFQYDGFFDPESTQESCYDAVASDIVGGVMGGFNGTILAYGQTSTGKTYTMMGSYVSGSARGIIPRAFNDVFQAVADRQERDIYKITTSYLQVYCEMLHDLLQPESEIGALTIRESDVPGQGVYVDGLSSFLVTSKSDCLEKLEVGNHNRTIAATKMNAHSSRSHAIFILNVERRSVKHADSTEAGVQEQVLFSKLMLVDLAGSERVKRTGAQFTQLAEAKAINLSLSALGNCISSLGKQNKHTPFRDSKLTRLLQYSLGGNCRTAMVVTVAPYGAGALDSSETLSALQFGQRALMVKTQAQLNVDMDYRTLYTKLQAEVDAKDDKERSLEIEVERLKEGNAKLVARLQAAERAKATIENEFRSVRAAHQVEVGAFKEAAGTDKSSQGVQAVAAKFNEGLAEVKKEHAKEMEEVNTKSIQQVTTYKTAAAEATAEWNQIEYDLQKEREGHLQTLGELRTLRERMAEAENAHVERIADMTDMLGKQQEAGEEELGSKLEAARSLAAEQGARAEELEKQLQRFVVKYKESKIELTADYVSREQVEQMQGLYHDTFERLQQRVAQLEGGKGASRCEDEPPAPPTRTLQLRNKREAGRTVAGIERRRKPIGSTVTREGGAGASANKEERERKRAERAKEREQRHQRRRAERNGVGGGTGGRGGVEGGVEGIGRQRQGPVAAARETVRIAVGRIHPQDRRTSGRR